MSKAGNARWRANNREYIRAANAEYRAANPHRIRHNNLKRTGFTLQLFEQTLEMQGHRCAICSADLRLMPSKQIHADHDHATGSPRGVLCHHCNAALGCFRDNPDTLLRAIQYLMAPPLSVLDLI